MDFRRELSTVSLPTRERDAAKAKYKELNAKQQGKVGTAAKPTTRKPRTKAPAPAPTLASKRQPRANRKEFTFAKRRGGLTMQGVLRHDNEEPVVPAVPYLPGQEDLPHFDEDDDAEMTEPEDVSPEMAGLLGNDNLYGGDIDSESAYPIEETGMGDANTATKNNFNQTSMEIDYNSFRYSEHMSDE
ncbi:hypothetical protein FRC09_001929 [Ceratobasidium sp. 395]|nr:hypothetical protein FRC09_001929 [Ceratobasidium sp. 395]